MDSLHETLLNDMLEQYPLYEESDCTSASAATAIDLDYPGPVTASSGFNDAFAEYEPALFQARMSHVDASDPSRSWTIRVGTGGNLYSHVAQHGETLPPQLHANAPWVDEVQQTVAVNLHLNRPNAPYYIHQAGAYQKDRSRMDDAPFYSPSLARHCADNSCTFASWGTQAHVPTPFTSPIIYINKYTNCDNGVIEHTQMIHK